MNLIKRLAGRLAGGAKSAASAVGVGWRNIISEPFTGAWQRNMELKVGSFEEYPTLYACLSRISQDIGKLPFSVKRKDSSGIWVDYETGAVSKVLKKPNHYQTAQQFREAWIMSKLVQGNTYALKERDAGGKVVALYVLDPNRVMPLVSDSGEVFYQLYSDNLNLIPDLKNELIVPASEIIHDRAMCRHPLIGIPPIAAAHWPVLKNMRILVSAAEFFGNNAQPSGILAAPGAISDETAKRLAEHWNTKFTGVNAGRVAVVGDGLAFHPLASKSVDAQMIEQLRYSDEQICQPFGIPPFKVGLGTIPSGLGVDAINQLYYTDALQAHIQAMETLLTIGLNVEPMRVDMDETVLMRMDAGKKAEYHTKLVAGSVQAINEARREFNLAPLVGGDTVYMQQQDFPLDQVRDNKIIRVTEQPAPEPVEPDEDEIEEQSKLMALLFEKGLRSELARN